MKAVKVKAFMELAGQSTDQQAQSCSEAERKLGAQLLLSEVLEYVIRGLGIVPMVKGVAITDPEEIEYQLSDQEPHEIEMIDGLDDVAYTMYWNASKFALNIEQAFELVCDNNLDKFVLLNGWQGGETVLERKAWHCGQGVSWPEEVNHVEVLQVHGNYFAVGKDVRGKVRKPSTYSSVDLSGLKN